MKEIESAIERTDEGCILHLQVITSSRAREFFHGYDPWRRSLVFSVREEPREGRANGELLVRLAELLHVPRNALELVSGARTHRKRVFVRGLEKERVLEALRREQGLERE